MTPHRRHLFWCGIGLLVAAGVLAVTGATTVGIAVLVAAIVCPVAMIVALRLLVLPPRGTPTAEGGERP